MTGSTDEANLLVGRFFRAVDTRDWDTVLALLAGTVQVDYTTVFGGVAEAVGAVELVTRWRGLLPGFDATQHFLGPLLATGPDRLECSGRAYHALGGQVWMIAGWYLLQTADGEAPGSKVISGITLTAAYETGPRALLEQAAQRAG